jgi:HTH-type transcriptional regulator/antitoxin HigA
MHPEEKSLTPGYAIQRELDARGWNQTDLTQVLGVHQSVVSALINNKRPVSLEIARDLAAAFGNDLNYWLKLESDYRLFAVGPGDPAIARRGRLFEAAPVKDLLKRRWIQGTDDIELLEKQVLAFYGVSSVADLAAKIPHAARKSGSYLKESASERFWVQRVRQLARAVSVTRKFSDAAFAEAMDQLRRLIAHPESARQIPKILADSGIRFVVVERLPQTRIDGVCLWLDKNSPVIALSLSYDRIDSLWFTLFHEMDHVKHRDGLATPPVIDSRLVGEDFIPSNEKPESERRADAFASAALIDPAQMDDFVTRITPLYSKQRIVGFAKRICVHPAIVVGQLHQRRELEWSQYRDLLVKIRDIVTAVALTDGWSQILPAVG